MRIFLAKEKADKDISQRGEGGQRIFLAKEKTDVGQGTFLAKEEKMDKRYFSQKLKDGQGYFYPKRRLSRIKFKKVEVVILNFGHAIVPLQKLICQS